MKIHRDFSVEDENVSACSVCNEKVGIVYTCEQREEPQQEMTIEMRHLEQLIAVLKELRQWLEEAQ